MGTVWIKQGVTGTLSKEVRRAMGRVAGAYFDKGKDFCITSMMEGNHSSGSFHYDGGAVDFKRQGFTKRDIKTIVGKDFDVIEYTDARDIFHLEYDPK